VAICPKCRCVLPEVGDRCGNDGWFGVSAEAIASGDKVVGFPIGGKFVALRKIGQGGMGTVYEGRQVDLGRTVAIKILNQNFQQSNEQVMARFQREARSIARVIHPNVVQLIDSGFEDNGVAYIVMEYVAGRELSSFEGYELSGQLIVHICHQILSALAEAHAMNVIHRDLKPDNIMLTREGSDEHFVKVLDFGLAALADNSKITVSGQALGTPWYMSPEQATAMAVTATTDLYSLGCILYELATSKPPFPGNRPFNVMMQHVNAKVPPLLLRPEVEFSSGMIAFILRCLEKDPQQRYASAQEAIEALHLLPEWAAAGQSDPGHSIRMVMRQLSEMGEIRSDVISGISAAVNDSGEVSGVHGSIRIGLDTLETRAPGSLHRISPVSNPLMAAMDPNLVLGSVKRRQRFTFVLVGLGVLLLILVCAVIWVIWR